MATRPAYLLMLLAALVVLAVARGDDPSPLTPRAGVLVLRNGHVLRGQFARTGDVYTLELAEGGTVRVPVSGVDVACRDLPEAYRIKQARFEHPTANQRLDLAEWCLQMDLSGGAAEQLLAAARLDPDNPRLPFIERKLSARLHPAPPVEQPPVVLARPVLQEELDEALRGLPPQAMEIFTTQVQPLLLNRCGTATCHGQASDNGFKLLRPALGQALARRITQRNLHAVLATIDRANPSASPLLTVPLEPHGPVRTGMFGPRERKQWEDLARFVDLVATNPGATTPATIARPDDTLHQSAGGNPLRAPPAAMPSAHTAPHTPGNSAADAAAISPGDENPDEAPLPAGLRAPRRVVPRPDEYQPRDPFDPEIFNRRYHAPPQP